jgi:NAD(P)-dependent dehydrogenase (short-subunit alcohol dehydrogenase family)
MTPPSKQAPVALVSGTRQGTGLETARRWATAGCTAVAARHRERGTVAAAEIGARSVPLEATSDASVAAAAVQVGADVGHLGILVDDAGITGPQDDVHDPTGAGTEQVLATNVVGYVRVIHAFLPLVERADKPRIANLTSGLRSLARFHDRSRIGSRAASPSDPASKAATNMLTVRDARALPGLRIDAADPGPTATALSGSMGHSATGSTGAIMPFAIGEDQDLTGRDHDRGRDVPRRARTSLPPSTPQHAPTLQGAA